MFTYTLLCVRDTHGRVSVLWQKSSRAFHVLAGVLNDLIHFVVSIPVMVAFLIYFRRYPSVVWLWCIPFLVGVQLLFTYSVALFIATCNLFFRDLERLTSIFTLMWFFLPLLLFVVRRPTVYDGLRHFLFILPALALLAALGATAVLDFVRARAGTEEIERRLVRVR